MMTKWFVVADKYRSQPDDPDDCVWTLSRNPDEIGWETDSGCPGYGLLKSDAEELANAANRIGKLEAEVLEWQKLGNIATKAVSDAVDDCVRATKLAKEKSEQLYEYISLCNKQAQTMAEMSLQIDVLAELAGVSVKPTRQ